MSSLVAILIIESSIVAVLALSLLIWCKLFDNNHRKES